MSYRSQTVIAASLQVLSNLQNLVWNAAVQTLEGVHQPWLVPHGQNCTSFTHLVSCGARSLKERESVSTDFPDSSDVANTLDPSSSCFAYLGAELLALHSRSLQTVGSHHVHWHMASTTVYCEIARGLDRSAVRYEYHVLDTVDDIIPHRTSSWMPFSRPTTGMMRESALASSYTHSFSA